MKIKIDDNYYAQSDFSDLGYLGETNARVIDVEQPTVDGADTYRLRFEYSDGVVYDVPIVDNKLTVESSMLRYVGDVSVQWVATQDNRLVAKSNVLALHIKDSLGDSEAIPTPEQSVSALDEIRILSAGAKTSADNAETSENNAQNSADIATDKSNIAVENANIALENAKTATEQAQLAQSAKLSAQESEKNAETYAETSKAHAEAVSSLEESARNYAEGANQSATSANTSAITATQQANIATQKATEISENAEQIQTNATDIETLQADKVDVSGEGQVTVKNCAFAETTDPVNMWNFNMLTGHYLNENSDKTSVWEASGNSTWSLSEGYIPAEANTEYWHKIFDNFNDSGIITKYRIIVYCFDADYNYLGKARNNTDTETSYGSKQQKSVVTKENTSYIRIQIYTSVVNFTQHWLSKSTDFTNTYSAPEKNYYLPFVKKSEVDSYVEDELKPYATITYASEIAHNTVSEGENIEPMKFSNGVTSLIDDLTVLANGMYFDHHVLNQRCKIVNHFSHDATMVIVNGKIYCAYVGNKSGSGDSPTYTSAYTGLAIVDTNGFGTSGTVTNFEVAKNGDTVDGKTITSGAGVPNCVAVDDDTIRIFFSAKLSDDIYYLFYRDYIISSGTFDDVKYCYFTIDSNKYVFSTPNINTYIKSINGTDYFISMNAQISKSEDDYYCGVCVGDKIPNSLIFKTNDLENFDFWLEPAFEDSAAIFEGACFCLGNYLYYALRQTYEGYDVSKASLLVAKINISTKNIVSTYRFRDAGARPCWYTDGTDLYLIHQICNRKRLEFVKINQSYLYLSKVVSVSSINMVYPCCVSYNDELYFCATGASSTSVYLRKAPTFKKYNCGTIQSRLVSALYLNEDWDN